MFDVLARKCPSLQKSNGKLMKNSFISGNVYRDIFLTVLFLFFLLFGSATNYYVSNSGNDSNPGTELQPWATINKVNSTSFSPGDRILFKKGDTFYGSLTIRNSGSSGNPITFGAYGTGEKPIITGFTTVSSWTYLGSNIWESTNAVSTLSTLNMVVIDGVNTPMGRYPDSGYLTYESYVSNTSITSSSVNSSTTNWTGAEVVIRKKQWIIDSYLITNHSGGTITYADGGAYNGVNDYGFFIQNDIRTLDATNEWYYNSSTKKISVYNESQPTNVKVAAISNIAVIDNYAFHNL